MTAVYGQSVISLVPQALAALAVQVQLAESPALEPQAALAPQA